MAERVLMKENSLKIIWLKLSWTIGYFIIIQLFPQKNPVDLFKIISIEKYASLKMFIASVRVMFGPTYELFFLFIFFVSNFLKSKQRSKLTDDSLFLTYYMKIDVSLDFEGKISLENLVILSQFSSQLGRFMKIELRY